MKRILLALLFLLPVAAFAQNIIGYPPGASPVAISNTANAATLPATTGRTTYLCGFVLTSSPGATPTGGTSAVTIAGMIGGTWNFAYQVVVSGQGLMGVAFPQCQPASGSGVPIVLTFPAVGSPQSYGILMYGYQL